MPGPVINLGVNPEAIAAVGDFGQAAKAQLGIVKQLETEVKKVSKDGQQASTELQRNLAQAYKDLDRYKAAAKDAKNTAAANREIASAAGSSFGRSTMSGSSSSFSSGPSMNTTFSTQERDRFKKQFDEELTRLQSGANAQMRGMSARSLSRSPHELMSLLQGGIGLHNVRGLAHAAEFIGEETGNKHLAALAAKLGNAVGTVAAGVTPTLLIGEAISSLFEEARNSEAAQASRAATSAVRKVFKGDNLAGTGTSEIERLLGQAFNPPDRGRAGFTIGGLDPYQDAQAKGARLRSEFATDVSRLDNDPRARVASQQFFGRAFLDANEHPVEIIKNMLRDGQDGGAMLSNLRHTLGLLDAQDAYQRKVDEELKRSPAALARLRNTEQMGRALEEMLIEQHQQWNRE